MIDAWTDIKEKITAISKILLLMDESRKNRCVYGGLDEAMVSRTLTP